MKNINETPCIFCGEKYLITAKRDSWESDHNHYIYCIGCYAKGPKETTKEKAIEGYKVFDNAAKPVIV